MEQADETQPSQSEWLNLYQTAIQFRDLAPWNWMFDSQTFGVQDPESGEIGYCCIMGNLGEHFALAVYDGTEGLHGLRQMREQGPQSNYTDIMMLQKCLMASFEDRDMLKPADLSQIKELGLKFRGRGAWPQFRSYLPGYAPWYLTGVQARCLTSALEQSMEVAKRLKDDPALVLEDRFGLPYLVRVPHGSSPDLTWKDVRLKPAPLPAKKVAPVPLSPEMRTQALQLKNLPKTRNVLEIDFFYMPATIQGENGGRSYFAYIVLTAEPESGRILSTNVSKPDAIASTVGKGLLDVLQSVQVLPARVNVEKEEALAYIEPVCAALGIRAAKVRQLKAISEAREGLMEYMAMGPPPGL